ncbi:hypothetical protein BRC81_05140 [Halobacteriales archaeon QS_1_68_20]|nr:MAG: hypothetical protein BRC81_05140 [Halobacteriales archaeon QS_1_68_20]
MSDSTDPDVWFLTRSVPVAAFVGGLCCFVPVVTVLLGLGTVSYAASLTDLLYGRHVWAFRAAGLAFLLAALVAHLYVNEGVCSVDAAVRRRRKILNLVVLSLSLAIAAYVIWLYVIVELIGLALGIW